MISGIEGKSNIKSEIREIDSNFCCLESESQDDDASLDCDINFNEFDEGPTNCSLRPSVVEVGSLWRNI